MKVTIIGRGGVGGGLARLFEAAQHEVTALGREAATRRKPTSSSSPARATRSRMRSGRCGESRGRSFSTRRTHSRGGRRGSTRSRSRSSPLPTGRSPRPFNANFGRLYEDVSRAGKRPSAFYCGDEEAKDVAEQLIRDAGYEPVYVGGLENARALEDFVVGVMLPVLMSGRGPFFYRIGGPEEL